MSAQHPYSTDGVHDSYLISPTFDLSGSSDVVVSYSEYIEWATWGRYSLCTIFRRL